jgi:hypothetical protein
MYACIESHCNNSILEVSGKADKLWEAITFPVPDVSRLKSNKELHNISLRWVHLLFERGQGAEMANTNTICNSHKCDSQGPSQDLDGQGL